MLVKYVMIPDFYFQQFILSCEHAPVPFCYLNATVVCVFSTRIFCQVESAGIHFVSVSFPYSCLALLDNKYCKCILSAGAGTNRYFHCKLNKPVFNI